MKYYENNNIQNEGLPYRQSCGLIRISVMYYGLLNISSLHNFSFCRLASKFIRERQDRALQLLFTKLNAPDINFRNTRVLKTVERGSTGIRGKNEFEKGGRGRRKWCINFHIGREYHDRSKCN